MSGNEGGLDLEALDPYRKKRDFTKTREPRGGEIEAGSWRFVVQKHDARRLHFDFRLELDGTLKSWAVTRGPSIDPADKRLAVHVEDHPLDYGTFEGTIPKGQYGGGTVMLWDEGTWEPLGDPHKDYKEGKLKFRLKGRRMKGGWALVRMGGRARSEKRDNWLLIKEKDRQAKPGEGTALVDRHDRSVSSRRTMKGIADSDDVQWQSKKSDHSASERSRPAAPKRSSTPGTKEALPDRIEPQLATLVDEPPTAEQWIHEIKLDGYRTLCRVEGGHVTLITRNGLDWTKRFPAVAKAASKLPVKSALVDGEIVALQADGRSSFNLLQDHLEKDRRVTLVLYAFDLLHLDGMSLRKLPLTKRKELLSDIVGSDATAVRYLDHQEGRGGRFLGAACSMALEGIISKKRDAPYRSGRSRDWLKSKCTERQEFVVIGFTGRKGTKGAIGSLVLAAHDGGNFTYQGRVGTGFDEQEAGKLFELLQPRAQDKPPVAKLTAEQRRGVTWTEPGLIVEISYSARTRDGLLRHAVYVGRREDKHMAEVEVEKPSPPPSASRAKGGKAKVAGIRISSPDKELWPEAGVTKQDLARYFEAMSEPILRHVKNRPLTLVRCPAGRAKQCFFQKHAGDGTDPSIQRVAVEEKGKQADYLFIKDEKGLVSLAQMGTLELHVWGSLVDRIEQPDRLVFDLDPDTSVAFKDVVEAAFFMRDELQGLKLKSFVKTTGGKGLHVVVPLTRRHEWDACRRFCKAFAERLAKENRDRFTSNMKKDARKGRIFVDWLRNGRGATAVTAYSPRARTGATVATPVTWDELAAGLDPTSFTIATLPDRFDKQGDPWSDMAKIRQSLRKELVA